MAILSQKVVGSFGILGAVLAAFCLAPKKYAIASGILVIFFFVLLDYIRSRWVESEPNEWLLVIKNGKLVRAGIGLKTFLMPMQSVVKFSSVVQKVTFKAKNVTKEMQGIEIEGFAFWSVFRDGEGPFKCYKYMQGGDANSSVQTMCESIVRNEMANCSLEEVLRDRHRLRDRMKKDLEKQLSGWGIWLETVQLTNVQICSNRLFEDLQADFRQETHLKAEQIRMNTKERMRQSTLTSELKLAQSRQDNETQKLKIRNEHALLRQQQESIYYEKTCEFTRRRMEKEKELTLERMNATQEQEIVRVNNSRELDKRKLDFEADNFKMDLEVDKTHNEVSLAKWAIDSAERVYNKMNVRDIKIHQFVGDNEKTVASLMPGLQYAIAQGRTAE